MSTPSITSKNHATPVIIGLPTFIFFKKLNCPPCNSFFAETYFSENDSELRLTNDPELIGKVAFQVVEFGARMDQKTGTIVVESIESTYPDMVSRIKYAPFLWFHPPRERGKGVEYPGTQERSFPTVKKWILEQLSKWKAEKGPSVERKGSVGPTASLVTDKPISARVSPAGTVSTPTSGPPSASTPPKRIGNGTDLIYNGIGISGAKKTVFKAFNA